MVYTEGPKGQGLVETGELRAQKARNGMHACMQLCLYICM